MTVAPPIDRAQRPAGSPLPDRPPLRWWTPAVTFAVFAVVLSVLVIAVGTNNGPLDDPNQAYQRDGALHHGPQLPDRIGDITFGGASWSCCSSERSRPPRASRSGKPPSPATGRVWSWTRGRAAHRRPDRAPVVTADRSGWTRDYRALRPRTLAWQLALLLAVETVLFAR